MIKAEQVLNVSFPSANYNEKAKQHWKRASMRFLRAVEDRLQAQGFDNTRVWFNPGGIAVSGDAGLFAFAESTGFGVELRLNIDGIGTPGGSGRPSGYYRWAEHRSDKNPGYPIGQMGPNRSFDGFFRNGASLLAVVLAESLTSEFAAKLRQEGIAMPKMTETGRSR